MQVKLVKMGDVRQTARYISKTIQDRRIVSIKVEQEVVRGRLTLQMTFSDPLTTPFGWFGVVRALGVTIFYILRRLSYPRNGCT